MRDWTLAKVVWVADRGFTSPRTAATCARAAATTSSARSSAPAPPRPAAALSRQGRYQEVAGNLRVKEVRIADDERFVICHNPDGAERDAADPRPA